MTALEHLTAVEFYLVVDSKVGVSAEELVALELVKHQEYLLQTVGGVVALAHIIGIGLEGTVAEGEGDVVAQHHHLVLGHQAEVALEPGHLLVGELAGLVVGTASVVDDIVDAHIVHVAAVEGVVGGSPCLFPLALEESLAVLVVVADDRERAHAGRAEHGAHLALQLLVVATIVLHVVAHAERIDGHIVGQRGEGLLDVGHGLVGETVYVALAHGVVVGALEIGAIGIGHLRVADDDELVAFLLALGHTGELEVITLHAVYYLPVEAGGIVGG